MQKQPTQPAQKFEQIYEQGDPRLKEVPLYFNGKLLSPSDPQYKELMAGYKNQMQGGKPQVKYDVPPEFKEQFAKMQQQGQFPTTLETTQLPTQVQNVQYQIPQAQVPQQAIPAQYTFASPTMQRPVIHGPTPGLPIMYHGKIIEVNDPMYQQVVNKYEAVNQEYAKPIAANPHGFDGFIVGNETIKPGDPRYEKMYQDYMNATLGKH